MNAIVLEKFERATRFLKDIFFPLFCIGCSIEGTILCENCIKKIPMLGIFCCPMCGEGSEGGVPCAQCKQYSFLDSLLNFTHYSDESLGAKLLHELKYNYIEETRYSFEKIFSFFFDREQFFLDFGFLAEYDAIVPVPLHPRRFAQRGFNQSEIFAVLLSQQLGIPVIKNVKRIQFTRPQVGLSSEERQKNVHAAFTVTASCENKKFLLVDDVYTTGSTMQECARVLKVHGASEVHGVTFARASMRE